MWDQQRAEGALPDEAAKREFRKSIPGVGPDTPGLPERQPQELIDACVAEAYPPGAAGVGGPGRRGAGGGASLVDIFVDDGHGYIRPGLLAWSTGSVTPFLGDWLLRKIFRDDAQREALPEVLRR